MNQIGLEAEEGENGGAGVIPPVGRTDPPFSTPVGRPATWARDRSGRFRTHPTRRTQMKVHQKVCQATGRGATYASSAGFRKVSCPRSSMRLEQLQAFTLIHVNPIYIYI